VVVGGLGVGVVLGEVGVEDGGTTVEVGYVNVAVTCLKHDPSLQNDPARQQFLPQHVCPLEQYSPDGQHS
jgi:hypothetical protein